MAKAQAGSRAASRADAAKAAPKSPVKAAPVKTASAKVAPVKGVPVKAAQPKPARAKGEASAARTEAAVDAKLAALFDAAPAPAEDRRVIAIRGAREHNLKNVDLTIPRDKLVVFTGLSGSGKSSLAFDTIYAEGQRRYVESLSAYARQFLEMMSKPDVDQIDGLSPAISIEQKTTSKNPRSTVGTVTEIYDYMRLLWARVGIPYSPATGLPIESQTVQQMVDRVLELPEKTRLYLLAPVVRGRKGEYRKEIAEYQKKGFQRLRVNGEYYAIDDVPKLDKKFKHDIDVVVDRIVVRADIGSRLADSFETALELADGIAEIVFADAPEGEAPRTITFSSRFACPVSGFTIAEIEPRLFSFNNPFGACPTCGGIGHEMR
ncbi:MAG: excinuclease ABC subunit A, partial [Hyphomicrobiales bacterium]